MGSQQYQSDSCANSLPKNTGAQIEVFCLEPLGMDYTTALTAKTNNQWLCFVGVQRNGRKVHFQNPIL